MDKQIDVILLDLIHESVERQLQILQGLMEENPVLVVESKALERSNQSFEIEN